MGFIGLGSVAFFKTEALRSSNI